MKPILDGQSVDPAVIDPAKHRYVGMWRPAEPPTNNHCPCGASFLYANDEVFADHWRRGHFDVPQYESIERPVLNPNTVTCWGGISELPKPTPARLRIPASEVKAGDVVWFSYNDGESWSRQGVAFCTPTVTISFGNFHSGVKSVRAIDELVEVERANG